MNSICHLQTAFCHRLSFLFPQLIYRSALDLGLLPLGDLNETSLKYKMLFFTFRIRKQKRFVKPTKLVVPPPLPPVVVVPPVVVLLLLVLMLIFMLILCCSSVAQTL